MKFYIDICVKLNLVANVKGSVESEFIACSASIN